ncbi:MAG: hypothetical protein Q9225_005655, partial [Loekoesia sp. 1 TL-2023]
DVIVLEVEGRDVVDEDEEEEEEVDDEVVVVVRELLLVVEAEFPPKPRLRHNSPVQLLVVDGGDVVEDPGELVMVVGVVDCKIDEEEREVDVVEPELPPPRPTLRHRRPVQPLVVVPAVDIEVGVPDKLGELVTIAADWVLTEEVPVEASEVTVAPDVDVAEPELPPKPTLRHKSPVQLDIAPLEVAVPDRLGEVKAVEVTVNPDVDVAEPELPPRPTLRHQSPVQLVDAPLEVEVPARLGELLIPVEVAVVTTPPGRVTGPTDTLIQRSPLHEEVPEVPEVVVDTPLPGVVAVFPPALRLRQRSPLHDVVGDVVAARVFGVEGVLAKPEEVDCERVVVKLLELTGLRAKVQPEPKLRQRFRQRRSVHVVTGDIEELLVETPGKLVKVDPIGRVDVELGLPGEGVIDKLIHNRPVHPEVFGVLDVIVGAGIEDVVDTDSPLVEEPVVLVGATTGEVILGDNAVFEGEDELVSETVQPARFRHRLTHKRSLHVVDASVEESAVAVPGVVVVARFVGVRTGELVLELEEMTIGEVELVSDTVQAEPRFKQRPTHKRSVHVVEGGAEGTVVTEPGIPVAAGLLVVAEEEIVLKVEGVTEKEFELVSDTTQLDPRPKQRFTQSRSLQVVVGVPEGTVVETPGVPVIVGPFWKDEVNKNVDVGELLLLDNDIVQPDPRFRQRLTQRKSVQVVVAGTAEDVVVDRPDVTTLAGKPDPRLRQRFTHRRPDVPVIVGVAWEDEVDESTETDAEKVPTGGCEVNGGADVLDTVDGGCPLHELPTQRLRHARPEHAVLDAVVLKPGDGEPVLGVLVDVPGVKVGDGSTESVDDVTVEVGLAIDPHDGPEHEEVADRGVPVLPVAAVELVSSVEVVEGTAFDDCEGEDVDEVPCEDGFEFDGQDGPTQEEVVDTVELGLAGCDPEVIWDDKSVETVDGVAVGKVGLEVDVQLSPRHEPGHNVPVQEDEERTVGTELLIGAVLDTGLEDVVI